MAKPPRISQSASELREIPGGTHYFEKKLKKKSIKKKRKEEEMEKEKEEKEKKKRKGKKEKQKEDFDLCRRWSDVTAVRTRDISSISQG